MGFLKKSKKTNKNLQAAVAGIMGTTDMMVSKGFYEARVKANVCTANNMLREAKPVMEQDIREHYRRELEKAKNRILEDVNAQLAEKEKAAWDHAEAYERKCRADYDEHMKHTKAEIKFEVIGDVLAQTAWVLRDWFGFKGEDIHKYILQLLRLEATMQESKQDDSKIEKFTVNDIVNQMKREGFDMEDDIQLVEEMVAAEMERFKRPYTPTGSVLNTWTEEEDTRLRRLIMEQKRDYPEIALVLQRTESACKSRVRKLFGTQVLDKVRGVRA